MRALLLVATLLVAGCAVGPADEAPRSRPDLAPMPGAPPADATWTDAPREEVVTFAAQDGIRDPDARGWRVRWSPGNLTGVAGDTARVMVALLPPDENATRVRFVVPQWAREPDGRPEVEVPPMGANLTLDVLMGPTAQLGAYLLAPDGDECCMYGTLAGPALGILPGGDPIRAVAKDDHAPALPGLRVESDATRVRGAWTYRNAGEFDCDEVARVAGTPVLRERVIHLFVAAGSSDACHGPSPPRTPRVEFEAGLLAPGEYEVRVHVVESCFCALQSWRTDVARVSVGG